MSYRIQESKSAATIRRKRHKVMGDVGLRQKSQTDDVIDLNYEDLEFYPREILSESTPVLNVIMSSDWILFLGLLAFRIINSLIIQTSYVPDEYWQSLEVAHGIAYGYGYKTWEWHQGLRGYTYPMMFAAVYKVLGVLHLDNRILLIKLPRMIQAVFSALCDLYLFKLSRKLSGSKVACWSLLCQLTSWFTFYCSTRTLTNSMETTLTTMALFYFPWPNRPRKAQWKYLSLVGLAIVVRPTAAILWLPLCAWHIIMYRMSWRVIKLFAEIGLAILCLSSIIDRFFYGKWVYVHYNFLEFNVLSNMGAFYGSHPWHWYLTQGFAVIMGTNVFIFILAVRRMVEPLLIGVVGWTVLVYSFLEHKEFRFLFPVLPIAFHICGKYLTHISDTATDKHSQETPDISDTPPVSKRKPFLSRKGVIVALLIITNLPLVFYTSLLHQRGTVDVMKFVADEASYKTRDISTNTMFLMPCHSTPWYSYVHRNVTMNFLTCEPNLKRQSNYVDEADIFYQNPVKWLQEEYESGHRPFPTHIVMFNKLKSLIEDTFLEKHSYSECAKFFHSHVTEGRVGSHVIVMCRADWLDARKAAQRRQLLLEASQSTFS